MPWRRLICLFYHIQINKLKTMKKILASLFVTSVTICSASAANSQVLSATSEHKGTVPASCGVATAITAENGTLVPNSTVLAPTSLSSETIPGSFTITCNSTHSFAATLVAGTLPGTESDYKREFRFFGAPTGTHNALNTTTTFASTFATVPGLAAAPSGYNVKVAARVSLNSGDPLPVSVTDGYVIKIQATVAPG
jgi:hypothetical protein